MQLFVVFLLAFVVPSIYSQFYTSFDPHGEGFTQELYGHAPITSNIFVGVAFINNQILVTNCDGNDAWLFSPTADQAEQGIMVHSATAKKMPYAGCNIINHPDGFLYYSALNRGIVKIDPATLLEVPINGQTGGQTNPRQSRLGMAVYPKDTTKIYFSTHAPEGIAILDTTTNQVSMFSFNDGIFSDGIFFNTEGDLLYLANLGNNFVTVMEVPSGVVKARVPIAAPDGIAFHDCTNSAFVANSYGELWRINGTTFTAELFASGAFRGDIGAVGPDGCFYLTYANGFRYPNGNVDFSQQSSLVKICNDQCGFSAPPGVPEPGGIACGDGSTRGQPFGPVSSLFNVLVFEDFSCKYSDTEGRLAAGGNIDVEGYSVGCKVFAEPEQNCINFGDVTCADISAADAWADTVVCGSSVNWAHGEVKAGNLAYGTTKALSNVNIVSDCAAHQSSPIDFAAEKAFLQEVSHNVKSTSATGTVVDSYGSLIFQGTEADIEIFSLSAAELGSAHGIKFEGVKATATVLINVSGKTVTAGNFGFFNVKPGKTLWNFWEATSLTFHSIQWEGSVLAVNADVKEPTGQINGQVFAKSWKGSNTGTCMQQNHAPFSGCVPTDDSGNIPPPPPPFCVEDCVDELYGATYYNAFIEEGFQCKFSDVEGRLAAGGDVTLEGMGFGSCILLDHSSDAPCVNYQSCAQFNEDNRNTLIAGGSIHGSGSSGVDAGDIVYSGTVAGVSVNGNGCAIKKQSDVIDFGAEFAQLRDTCANLLTLAPTGTVTNNFGTLIFQGEGSLDLEIFEVDATAIGGANGLRLQGVKDKATVIINVKGTSLNAGSFALFNFQPRYTIWNLCEQTTVTLQNVGWRGTLLAPNAALNNLRGQIDGQVIAKSWNGGTGACMELHEHPFKGCIPECF